MCKLNGYFHCQVPTFYAPSSIIDIDGTEKSWPIKSTNRPAKCDYIFSKTPGFIYEAEEVRKCIRTGKIESELVSHSESALIAHIQDEMRKQIGVKYPEDD